jgi:hypothetical protein
MPYLTCRLDSLVLCAGHLLHGKQPLRGVCRLIVNYSHEPDTGRVMCPFIGESLLLAYVARWQACCSALQGGRPAWSEWIAWHSLREGRHCARRAERTLLRGHELHVIPSPSRSPPISHPTARSPQAKCFPPGHFLSAVRFVTRCGGL